VQEAAEASVADAIRRGRLDEAASVGLRAYGPEILGFLVALGPSTAEDSFSQFCEDLWRGLPAYRAQASFRTWAYAIARNASTRIKRDPYARRKQALSDLGPLSNLAAELRSSTATYLLSHVRDRIARLRDDLSEDDRTLLVLKVDRQMSYADIARIMLGEVASEPEIEKRSAALRKRFERLKQELRSRAEREGIIEKKAKRG
jgi:RNA polymerase sigma-70 factor, ECF subfamily